MTGSIVCRQLTASFFSFDIAAKDLPDVDVCPVAGENQLLLY